MGFVAVSAPGISDFIGWLGLWPIGFEAHFTPAIEVGWQKLSLQSTSHLFSI
jgi:hypothetical protein